MKPVDSKMKDRVCVVCNNSYRPTAYRQKSCAPCKQEFRALKMPGWKQVFKDKDLDYNKIYQRKYYKKYPERYVYWGIKRRCRLNNIPFDIEVDDIKFPEYCPVLGIKLERNSGGKSAKRNSPSVDRINPKLGYTKGNIQIISYKANTMKNDASSEDLLKFADWIYANYKNT